MATAFRLQQMLHSLHSIKKYFFAQLQLLQEVQAKSQKEAVMHEEKWGGHCSSFVAMLRLLHSTTDR